MYSLAAVAVLALTGSSFAADQTIVNTPNQDEVICKNAMPATGSRIGARKICHTRREWEERQKEDRQMTEGVQKQDSRNPDPPH